MSCKDWEYWDLESLEGRQIWRFNPPAQIPGDEKFWSSKEGRAFLATHDGAFVFDASKNPNSADKVYRDPRMTKARLGAQGHSPNLEESLRRAIHSFGRLQTDDGHWPGDYGGPMFLLPGLVFASYVTSTPFKEPHRTLMIRYMLNHQNHDGGWGLHIEGTSTMFGTVMQYVALRILGGLPSDPELVKARDWIMEHGDARGIPSWGKFYLSVLGVYEWEGNNSLLPEMWLLPRWAPFHPGRYWCHCRMVYLPMSYCFGAKVVGPITELVKDIRKEIYSVDYDGIDWVRSRDTCCDTDRYTKGNQLMTSLLILLNIYEKHRNSHLRKKALRFSLEYIQAEDDHTHHIDIGPVNKVINSICIWHAFGPKSEQFRLHADRWFDYLWLAEDGIKMSGYNGSQLWDTAFAAQAIAESGRGQEFPEILLKAYQYLDVAQVKNEVRDPDKYFRHASVGGWPFSTADHGWPITDCTSEGLAATLEIMDSGIEIPEKISTGRLCQAADLLLTFQNKNGGWATYELTRGPAWLEILNPSEVFGDIMVDYPYTECTSACIRSLARFAQRFPEHNREKIRRAIEQGAQFIRTRQLPDGAWIGSWGICFTYGTWFGIEGLASAAQILDLMVNHELTSACQFLAARQNPDGGWGESYLSSVQKQYVGSESQIINTSWALLALMAANHSDMTPIKKGIQFLMKRQLSNGDWPQERISGVFNSNCMITYANYRNIFPIWALGRYQRTYGDLE